MYLLLHYAPLIDRVHEKGSALLPDEKGVLPKPIRCHEYDTRGLVRTKPVECTNTRVNQLPKKTSLQSYADARVHLRCTGIGTDVLRDELDDARRAAVRVSTHPRGGRALDGDKLFSALRQRFGRVHIFARILRLLGKRGCHSTCSERVYVYGGSRCGEVIARVKKKQVMSNVGTSH